MTKRKKTPAAAKRPTKHKPVKKRLLTTAAVIAALLLVVYISFQVSPRPGAMVIRTAFNHGAHKTLRAMEAQLPNYPVTVLSNQQYRQNDKAAKLDVYIPTEALAEPTALPAVVWTHGGGWLSGNKTDDAPYFKRLADQGFVVIAPNYSLAPAKTYPTPVYQLNEAYAYIQANAARYHLDPNKIVLAGDSAGAQLSSQMAALTTNPSYAQEIGITPSLRPSQLAGVVLFCGIYKMETLAEPAPSLPKIIDWGDSTTVWAYTGSQDKSSPLIRQMSAYYHVTKSFPATFISGGNGDPLTDTQSIPFSQKLLSLGVNVTALFYPSNHQPKLAHEYQFTFNQDGERAFDQTVHFLKVTTN